MRIIKKRMLHHVMLLAGLVALSARSMAAEQTAGSCPIIDAYSILARTAVSNAGASQAEQLNAFRHRVLAAFPGNYGDSAL